MASAVQTTNQDLGPPTADSIIFKGTVIAAEQRFALAGFKGRHITVVNGGEELLFVSFGDVTVVASGQWPVGPGSEQRYRVPLDSVVTHVAVFSTATGTAAGIRVS